MNSIEFDEFEELTESEMMAIQGGDWGDFYSQFIAYEQRLAKQAKRANDNALGLI